VALVSLSPGCKGWVTPSDGIELDLPMVVSKSGGNPKPDVFVSPKPDVLVAEAPIDGARTDTGVPSGIPKPDVFVSPNPDEFVRPKPDAFVCPKPDACVTPKPDVDDAPIDGDTGVHGMHQVEPGVGDVGDTGTLLNQVDDVDAMEAIGELIGGKKPWSRAAGKLGVIIGGSATVIVGAEADEAMCPFSGSCGGASTVFEAPSGS